MKKVVLMSALMLFAASAMAEQVLVTQGKGHQCRGDKFDISQPIEVLYPERACELPLADKSGWMAYRFQGPRLQQNGCFGRALDGSYVIVREDSVRTTASSNAYVMAKLSSNGKATVLASPNQDTPHAKAIEMCP
ncbi:hypothetical protein NPS58_04055 [Pseudomonas putida]|uniref:hypothetical protein n=1 Tax=Pseudomonas putida TaxID=303 RepID=UPI0023643312|nr:hypothetical protein [Pseudomonas putida]MDD2056620.1 hypothetical protein [Pseudomonas putida]